MGMIKLERFVNSVIDNWLYLVYNKLLKMEYGWKRFLMVFVHVLWWLLWVPLVTAFLIAPALVVIVFNDAYRG